MRRPKISSSLTRDVAETRSKQSSARWLLTVEERERLELAAAESLSVRHVLRILARSPRLSREVVSTAAQSAVEGIASNSSLVWVLDAERVRGIIPDAASGATWVDEDMSVAPILERANRQMTVLDLGCGAGRLARHVAPRVGALVCADVSGVLLDEAKSNLAGYPNVSFTHNRGFTLEALADESFDLVYAQGVFSYIEPMKAVALLDEVRRVLRANGRLVVNVFVIDAIATWWQERVVAEARRSAERHRFNAKTPRPYSSGYFSELLDIAGLTVVQSTEGSPWLFVAQRTSAEPGEA